MAVSISKNIRLGGLTFAPSYSIDCNMQPNLSETIAAAIRGELTTRTDANTGVITMVTASHGFLLNDIVDDYWSTGSRLDMTVTNVSGADVTVDGGTGDDLPIATTSINIAAQNTFPLSYPITNNYAILAELTTKGRVKFLNESSVSILDIELTAFKTWEWSDYFASPYTGYGPVANVIVSNGDSWSSIVQIGVALDG